MLAGTCHVRADDHFGFHGRRTVAYNGHIYLTALGAVQGMAAAVGDAVTGAAAAKVSAPYIAARWCSVLTHVVCALPSLPEGNGFSTIEADAADLVGWLSVGF